MIDAWGWILCENHFYKNIDQGITGHFSLPCVYVSKHQHDLTLSLTQIKGLAYFS